MFCVSCGTEILEGNAFCTQCGRSVLANISNSEPQASEAAKGSGWRRFLLVVSVVLLIWAGSAGMAYGVVELTGGGPQGEQGERGPRGERGPAGAAGASGFSTDSSACHRDLIDLILVVNNKFTGQLSGAVLEQEVNDVVARLSSSC